MIRPVLLCGGGGTRLWPISRTGNPKQFLSFFSNETLVQATARRCHGAGFYAPVIATSEDQRFFVAEQLAASGITPDVILLEPVPRNTAAAIALAATWSRAIGSDDPMLVMPSDHLIEDVPAFHSAVAKAIPAAMEGSLVSFGVQPECANTGYGYIESESDGRPGDLARIRRFTEKPDLPTATRFLADGGYYWNAGIFLFRPSVFLKELERYGPDIARSVIASMADPELDGRFLRPDPAAFAEAPSLSIDYAVMEKTDAAVVMPMTVGWSDIGSWDAVKDKLPANSDGNSLSGNVVALDVRNSLIRSDSDIAVGVVGVENLMCVITHDAALIAPLDRAQDVKWVVERLRELGDNRADEPAKVFRPWGSYQVMDRGERFQTKHLIVQPGGRLSLQRHQHRSEHWVVVKGTAEVTIGDETRLLMENESTYIPAGTNHRLANSGDEPLHLVEVQCGQYLGEDDIVRLDDNYGRS